MIQIHALKSTVFVQNYIRRTQAGRVHSVYRNTVNLNLGGLLLALQTSSSPLSPVSIHLPLDTAHMEGLFVSSGIPCYCQNNSIVIRRGQVLRDLRILLTTETDIIPTMLADRNGAPVISASICLQTARQILMSSPGSGFVPAVLVDKPAPQDRTEFPSAPYLKTVRQTLESARSLFLHQQWKEAAGILCRLIGLGTGLTPSGDDFLCGLLSCLRRFFPATHPFRRQMERQILGSLSRTHMISATFLLCACRGEFSQAVLDFYQNERLPDPPDFFRLRDSFLAIGHSSGLDTLCGIYYGLLLTQPPCA